MSKFIDYLSRIGDPTPVPMGFGPVKSKERQPSILLVGSIQLTKLANKPESASVPVDSVIIEAKEFEEDLNTVKKIIYRWETWTKTSKLYRSFNKRWDEKK